MWDIVYGNSAYIQKRLKHVKNKPRTLLSFQNLLGEHSIAGVPASLYNITKSVPDPFNGFKETLLIYHLCIHKIIR